MVISRLIVWLMALCATAGFLNGQLPPDDPGWAPLDQGYRCLQAKDWDCAVRWFREAAEKSPSHPSIHKELGYTLLRIGETEKARDAFAAAVKIDPSDHHITLEYAFLCYETRRRAEAMRLFRRVRDQAQPPARDTAAEVFNRLDAELAVQIDRWKEAARITPDDFSAHHELALLAEERGDLDLALRHYRESWRIRSDLREILLAIGKILTAQGQDAAAHSYFLAASHAPEPRVADEARDFLPPRDPELAEYEAALGVDPDNFLLRRAYGSALDRAGRSEDARLQHERIAALDPKDLTTATQLARLLIEEKRRDKAEPLLERVIAGKDEQLREKARTLLGRDLRVVEEAPAALAGMAPEEEVPARQMGFLSFQRGFLLDARRYLEQAVSDDPDDYEAALKLAWTFNALKRDDEAVRWFSVARKSPNRDVAEEAARAHRNLTEVESPVVSTVWALPMYSSRWNNLFAYSQGKTEFFKNSPVLPYASVRFMGDARQKLGGPFPQYLSETAFVPGVGARTRPWHGVVGWGEAGVAVSYIHRQDGTARFTPDYRGGASWTRGFGHLLGAPSPGRFSEINADAVYVSRFDNNTLFYAQHRAGYTPRKSESLGGMEWQVYWNTNVTLDAKRQYWANFAEIGPGIALRWKHWPPALRFTVNALRGFYLRSEGNPGKPNFIDIRVGFWYAFSR